MRQRLKEKAIKPASGNGCKHYWIIEGAKGPTSRGVCKYCGEEREFQNSWQEMSYSERSARVFELPNLVEIEPVEEQDDAGLDGVSAGL